jgi:hypothetical protein
MNPDRETMSEDVPAPHGQDQAAQLMVAGALASTIPRTPRNHRHPAGQQRLLGMRPVAYATAELATERAPGSQTDQVGPGRVLEILAPTVRFQAVQHVPVGLDGRILIDRGRESIAQLTGDPGGTDQPTDLLGPTALGTGKSGRQAALVPRVVQSRPRVASTTETGTRPAGEINSFVRKAEVLDEDLIVMIGVRPRRRRLGGSRVILVRCWEMRRRTSVSAR